MSDIQEIDEIVPLGVGPVRGPDLPRTMATAGAFQASAPQIGPAATDAVSHGTGKTHGSQRPKGMLGILAAVGMAIAKWWAVALSVLFKFKGILLAAKFLTAGKLLLTGGTMFLSMFLWSYRFGWPMAVGLVLSIFIHECGHALAARKLGHKLGIMVFIPFMGALVTSRGGRTVTEGAFVGIMGPIAGTAAALACVGVFAATHNPFWLALATIGFFINLVNLVPARPLDGGWIAPLFSPKLLLPGIVLALLVFHNNPMVWMLAIMSIPSTIHAWRHGHESPYYKATSRDRWLYGSAYVGLIAFLAASLFTVSGYRRAYNGSSVEYSRQTRGIRPAQ